jgi:dethiobiotin synthetase
MRYFVTGTDTDVGKTYVSCGLLDVFNAQGLSTIGIKAVASGCIKMPEGLRSQDALLLQQHSSVVLPYDVINPIAFEPPIAPHIAAQQVGFHLTQKNMLEKCSEALNTRADIHLIEGAGGWLVPLHDYEFLADFAKTLDAQIILVVGMRLGCINHALLTVESIQNRGCILKGWVANCIDPLMDYCIDNINTLKQAIAAPLLGVVPYQGDVAQCIRFA